MGADGPPALPAPLVRALHRRLGQARARRWLDVALPMALDRCRIEWALTVDGVMDGGTTGALFAVRRPGGDHAVLKLSPDHGLAAHERLGWELWSERGLPRLLAHNADHGALLIERVLPGTSLLDPAVHDAPGHASRLLLRLTTATVARALPTLAERVDGRLRHARSVVEEGDNAVGATLLRTAELAAERMLRNHDPPAPLHGDYFPDNILWSETRGWTAIDPQPCMGDLAFDAGTWCYAYERGRNVATHAEPFVVTFGLNLERIVAWARIVAITNLAGRFAYGHASEQEVLSTLAFAGS